MQHRGKLVREGERVVGNVHPLSLIYACSLDLGEAGFATGEASKLRRKMR